MIWNYAKQRNDNEKISQAVSIVVFWKIIITMMRMILIMVTIIMILIIMIITMIKAMPWQTFDPQARIEPILSSHRHNRLWQWFQIHNFEISRMTKLSIVKCANHCVVAKVQATEILIPVGNCNSHVGAPAGVFGDAHGGHGFWIHNKEDEKILEFAIAMVSVSATPGSRRETHTWPHTAPVATQPRWTTHSIARVSTGLSATWKSSLRRSASNSTTC